MVQQEHGAEQILARAEGLRKAAAQLPSAVARIPSWRGGAAEDRRGAEGRCAAVAREQGQARGR
jgi:hypothetical protein